MSDSRSSPIPQDRVDANTDQEQLAADDQRRMAETERYLERQGEDGGEAEEGGPAEGGD